MRRLFGVELNVFAPIALKIFTFVENSIVSIDVEEGSRTYTLNVYKY